MSVHLMETSSRVTYARTLADVVMKDAIKTARDVLAATGADSEQLEDEVNWTFSRAKIIYDAHKPAKENPEQIDWNWSQYINVLSKVHQDAHNCAEKLAKKIVSSHLEEFFVKELNVCVPDILANLMVSIVECDEKLKETLSYAKKPDQGMMKFAYRVAKFRENYYNNIHEEAKLIWTFAKDGTLAEIEGTEE